MPKIDRLSKDYTNRIYELNAVTPEEKIAIENFVNWTHCRNQDNKEMTEKTKSIMSMKRGDLLMKIAMNILKELTLIGAERTENFVNSRKAGM